jgi:CBS domain-containing protein/anti-sigma regulatory factor (Ser/Thr protein kinase)
VSHIPIDTDNSPSFVYELIYQLKVRDVMTREVSTLAPGDTLRLAQQTMKERGITGLPVVDGNRLVGIISVDDIIGALDAGYIEESVEAHMTRGVVVLEDDMPLSFAISYLDKYTYGRFPVLNKDKELVGIITSRDVIVSLLLEVNREVEKFEAAQQRRSADKHESGSCRKSFTTRPLDFEHAGKPSTEVKRYMKERGFPPKLMRRVAVAMYELEMNQVVHSVGGTISFYCEKGKTVITAEDAGPGIENVEDALTEGFSTATDWVRSLGFGAGMGLPNVRRVSDEFDLQSDKEGTRATSIIYKPEENSCS